MKIQIIITDDSGNELHFTEGSALQTQQFRTHPERPLMDGTRNFWGFVYQPIVTLDLNRGK